jgi:hypothetical protein
MFRYKTLAWALACVLLGGTATAAQELVYPDSNSPAMASDAAATAAKPPAARITLSAKALASDELRVSWTAIANDQGYSIEIRTNTTGWMDIGPLRLGPPCRGCAGAVHVIGVQQGETYYFRLRRKGVAAPVSNEAAATPFYLVAPGCDEGGALCLDGRYRVDARYESNREGVGRGRGVTLAPETGYLWFFEPGNLELVAKTVDGCATNQHNWIYLSGLTSLRTVIVVTDTQSGVTATFLKEANKPFTTIQDTTTFACR